jgi:hypothetical protein
MRRDLGYLPQVARQNNVGAVRKESADSPLQVKKWRKRAGQKIGGYLGRQFFHIIGNTHKPHSVFT